MSGYHHSRKVGSSIPTKANKVLNLILIVMILIIARIWHLTYVQHEDKLDASKRPQQRLIVEQAERATIRDRFNLPLAINTVKYNALISYAEIKEIPTFVWEKNGEGKRVRRFKRKEYISNLSKIIAKELNMEADRLEDLIHGKAALLNHIPLIIKEDLSEEEFYRLKLLEKDYPGLQTARVAKRVYPKGCVACDIVGYMGPISKEEYDKIIFETHALQDYLKSVEFDPEAELPSGIHSPQQARKRLKELQEIGFTIHDYVGKSGIEGYFDETLRGFRGKKIIAADSKGRFIKELPGAKEPLSGQRFLLTISSELQEFAEALLAENEKLREGRNFTLDKKTHSYIPVKQPWIKGGAIIAMDPNSGEILALASYPRFNPEDFIPASNEEENLEKKSKIYKWLESDLHIAELWDQKQLLTRERYSFASNGFYEESKLLTWESYLHFVLPEGHPIKETLSNYNKVQHAIKIQQNCKALLALAEASKIAPVLNLLYENAIPLKNKLPAQEIEKIKENLKKHQSSIAKIKKNLDPFFDKLERTYDKVLLLDLYSLIADSSYFSKNLQEKIGSKTLSQFREISASFTKIQEIVQKHAKEIFHQHEFPKWREENQKNYLLEMRALEKKNHTYQRPYIEYLDKKEKQLFNEFWKKHKIELINLFTVEQKPTDPSLELYGNLLSEVKFDYAEDQSLSLLKKELEEIPDSLKEEYLASLRKYSDLTRPLYGSYSFLRSHKGLQLEKHLAAAFYPKNGFGYGRSQAFRQSAQLGSIFKLVTAYCSLIQPYRQGFYPADHHISSYELNPLTIIDDLHKVKSSWNVGYTTKGEPIPQHYKGGRIPKSQHAHIGKVDLARAIETSSNPYFALLAGDIIEKPEDLINAAKTLSYGRKTGIQLPGEFAGSVPSDVTSNKSYLYAFSIGQHSLVTTPLQTAVMLSALANKGYVLQPNIVRLQAGKMPVRGSDNFFGDSGFPYQDSLLLAGIDFPLFSGSIASRKENSVITSKPLVKEELFLPASVRKYLLDAMREVVQGSQGTAREQVIKTFSHRPSVIKDYLDIQNHLIGKTSTAEMTERVDITEDGVKMVNHIGFSGISFEPDSDSSSFEKPELVIVVYLRFGDYGKEAAPLAAQIVKKWREIKAKHK